MVILYEIFYILHIDVWFPENFPSQKRVTYFNINFDLQSQHEEYDFFFQFLARASTNSFHLFNFSYTFLLNNANVSYDFGH